MNEPPFIKLHIEELVLHGFPEGDRQRIAEALQGELARLLAHPASMPLLTRSPQSEQLDGGSFPVGNHLKPEIIGAQAARSLHQSLQK